MTISSTNTKNSYSGDGSTVAFSYTFKILDDDDIQVILRTNATGTETVQTKTTHYSVSGVGNAGGGTITFVSAPAATETVVLLRNVPLTQTTDYTPNDPFPAVTHEDALDKLTLMAQDTQEEVDRSIKLSRTNTMTSTEFTVGATARANKIFAFDSSGELAVTQEIGTFQGDWAASTAYAERDLVKDTSTNNIFIVNSAHTSSGSQPLTTNPNASKYDLIVDAASATTSATNAATSATAAATSATAAANSATAAATSESNAAASEAGVAADAAAAAASAASASTSETNASTSETNAANSASAAATSATNAATSATSASNSASSAGTSETNAATSATNASNSASAAATSASNASTSETNAATSESNASTSASSASTSASNAAASAAAAAASFDAFDDIYLGAKASAPTVDNDGDALTEGDQYFNTTNNTLFVWNGSAWQAASPDIVADTTPQLGGNLDTNGNDINFGDNDKAVFGGGSDLQIYHNGTSSFIEDTGSGDLFIRGAANVQIEGSTAGENMIYATENGAVRLYYDANQKLATTSSGIDVTGTVTADGLNLDDSDVIAWGSGSSRPAIIGNNTTDDLDFYVDGAKALNISSGNDISFYDSTGTTSAFFWDASTQRLGLGTTGPAQNLHIEDTSASVRQRFVTGTTNQVSIDFGDTDSGTVGRIEYDHATDAMAFRTNAAERLRVTSGGNLTFSQEASGSPYPEQKIKWSNDSTTANGFYLSQDTSRNGRVWHEQGLDVLFGTNNTERMRIDSSGNVGIGTTSPTGKLTISEANGANAPTTISAANTYLHLGSGDFGASNNGKFMIGFGYTNGTANTNSPAYIGYQETSTGGNTKGDLTFHTRDVTTDTAPSERMRINSSGTVLINKTSTDFNTAGIRMDSEVNVTRANATPVFINRTGNDGGLIQFYQAGVEEGSISVSGTTVSYNGGHLARWSQLADNTKDTSIVKGTVMTNLDQMAEWTKDGVTEDNEQLNCMAVSSVEGDANVAGVFVNWDDDDEDHTADMNIAMTGDMVIRIAQGTTVARGDLLMSAGDGTAKPQGDDIVRSKTIAKVTSTTVSHTYDDGSYLVPCVLMAC